MKTFADIKWKSHKSDPKAIQGLLPLSGGAELSVVAGDWMYCTPKKSLGNPDLHSSFEIAFFDKDGVQVDPVPVKYGSEVLKISF